MKKWTLDKIDNEIESRKDVYGKFQNPPIPAWAVNIRDEKIFEVKVAFAGILGVIEKRHLEKAVDVGKIVGQTLGNPLWYYWPEKFLKDVEIELDRGFIRPDFQFQKVKISPKGHYTKKEAAEFLHITPGRIDQLVSEGKIKLMGKTFNRGNKRVILGADLIEYIKTQKK